MTNFYYEKYLVSRLEITIKDKDLLKDDDFIGKFEIPLKSLKIDEENDEWYRLPVFDQSNQATISFIRLHLKLRFYDKEVSKMRYTDWSKSSKIGEI